MRILALIISGLLLAAPSASAAARAPFSLFPVVGGAHYTNDFGDPRWGGSHEGNDLLAPCGTPTVAVVSGTVDMSYGANSGWMLRLTGRTSWYYYIHMDGRHGARSAFARGLRDGSRVRAGQIIAYVGNTGDAAGGPCHLHFEYHRGTRVYSPFRYLEQARILQLDPDDPLSSNAVARKVTLRVTGVVAWTATARDGGRLILRPESISTSDGTRVGHAGTVALRIPPELLDRASVGMRVTVRTVPMVMTTALQDVAPYTWTVATVS